MASQQGVPLAGVCCSRRCSTRQGYCRQSHTLPRGPGGGGGGGNAKNKPIKNKDATTPLPPFLSLASIDCSLSFLLLCLRLCLCLSVSLSVSARLFLCPREIARGDNPSINSMFLLEESGEVTVLTDFLLVTQGGHLAQWRQTLDALMGHCPWLKIALPTRGDKVDQL